MRLGPCQGGRRNAGGHPSPVHAARRLVVSATNRRTGEERAGAGFRPQRAGRASAPPAIDVASGRVGPSRTREQTSIVCVADVSSMGVEQFRPGGDAAQNDDEIVYVKTVQIPPFSGQNAPSSLPQARDENGCVMETACWESPPASARTPRFPRGAL